MMIFDIKINIIQIYLKSMNNLFHSFYWNSILYSIDFISFFIDFISFFMYFIYFLMNFKLLKVFY